MIQRATCPVCDLPGRGLPAKIAPFVVYRSRLLKANTLSMYCPDCDFVWFSDGYDADEINRLYAGYRGEEYNALRLKLEPSYAYYVQNVFDSMENEHYRERIRWTCELFRKTGVNPHTILDFGGDGSIPRRMFESARVDYCDVSHGSSVQGSRHDLVVAAHVLEHASNPKQMLAELLGSMAEGGYCYVEVPITYQGELRDAYFRQFYQGGDLFSMHEHINHFSALALQKLLVTCGMKPIRCESHPGLNSIGVLSKRADATATAISPIEVEKIAIASVASAGTKLKTLWHRFVAYARHRGVIRAIYKTIVSILEKAHRSAIADQ
jgi:hypothetical protein